MTASSRNSVSGIPPPTHGISRGMTSPTIQISNGGFQISGSGLCLTNIPIEQDAAYWEWHITLPGLPRAPKDGEEEDDFQDVQMDGNGSSDDDDNDIDDDPYALKFGVATRKDRNFYKSLESAQDEGSKDDGTVLMRSIPNLRHGDVIGIAVQQSDLPMIQMLLNGEPLMECSINRFRGMVFPSVYIPAGANGGDGERIEDAEEGISLRVEFDEDGFREMSPHARFGPLLAARGII